MKKIKEIDKEIINIERILENKNLTIEYVVILMKKIKDLKEIKKRIIFKKNLMEAINNANKDNVAEHKRK